MAPAVDEAETLRRAQEQEREALLIAGAPDTEAEKGDLLRFIRSNRRHMYTDGVLGCATYTFSALQHVQGQSTALTMITLWAAGTTYLINGSMRRYLNDVSLQSPLLAPPPSQQRADETPAQGDGSSTMTAGSTTSAAGATGSAAWVGFSPSSSAARGGSLVAQDIAKEKRNVFKLEAVASWLWMMASLEQFKVHKRLKWCGYSSWMGLGCAGYYTLRYAYNLMVD